MAIVSGVIGNSVIKIALDGWSQVQQQLKTLTAAAATAAEKASASFNHLTQSVNSLGSIFSQASSAVRGFASVADPRGALELELAFVRLQVAIGRFFIPILREAGQQVNRLAAFINSLSNETREQVSHFTKWALAVTGVSAGLGVFAGIVAQLVSFLRPLVAILSTVGGVMWRVLGFLGPWGRLAVIIGSVAAALLGLSEAGGSVSVLMGRIVSSAKSAWAALQEMFGKLASAVAPAVAKVEAIFEGLWEFVKTALANFVPVLMAHGRAIGEILSRSFQLLGKVVEALMPVLEKIGEALARLFSGGNSDRLADVFAEWARQIELTIPLINKVFDFLDRAVTQAAPLIRSLAEDFGSLFSGNSFAGLAEALRPVLGLMMAIGQAARTVGLAVQSFGGEVFAGLSMQLEKLRPSLERVGEIFRTVFDYAREQGRAVADVLGGIAERVGPPLIALFSRLGVLISGMFNLATSLVNLIGNGLAAGFAKLSTAVGPVLDFIGDKVQWILDKLSDGFNTVWNPIKDGITTVAHWFLWLAHSVEHYFVKAINAVLGVVNGMIRGINDLIDKINSIPHPGLPDIGRFDPLPDVKKTGNFEQDKKVLDTLTEKAKKDQTIQPQARPQVPPRIQPEANIINRVFEALKPAIGQMQGQGGNADKFTGQLLGNARFVGIAEAMRAAQQATVPTRETVVMEEINRQLGQQTQIQEKIAENTGKQPNLGLGR